MMRRNVLWPVSVFFVLSCALMAVFVFTEDVGRVFWRFAVLIVSNAVVMGWIVNGSGGSLLLASLYHFSLNASTLIAGCVLHKRVGTNYLSQEGLYLIYAVIVGFAGFKKRGARQWPESYAGTPGNG